MKRILKRVALILAVLLVALVGLAVAAVAKKHAGHIRPVTGDKIEATPARLERGGYLVNQVLACGACHTSRATGDIMTEGERADAFLGGGNSSTNPDLGATVWVPNITPDPDTGIGRWSDDEVLRMLRDGVRNDDRFAEPMMPYNAYQHLSDEDARSVVAYLRSVPAYRQQKPREPNQMPFLGKLLFEHIGVQMHAPVKDVPPPARGDKLGYGRYLMFVAACTECHSLTKRGPRKPEDPLFMAGSETSFTDAAVGKVWARNLTSDVETGLGKYSAEQIKQALRNGMRLDGKRMAPPMAVMIAHYSGMTEEDLDALVAFIKSLSAARNAVPERQLTDAMRAIYDAPPPPAAPSAK